MISWGFSGLMGSEDLMFKHEGFHGKRMELNHGPKTAPIHPLLWHNMGIEPRTMGIRWGPEWDIVEWEKKVRPPVHHC